MMLIYMLNAAIVTTHQGEHFADGAAAMLGRCRAGSGGDVSGRRAFLATYSHTHLSPLF